jgi:hypothetical protein
MLRKPNVIAAVVLLLAGGLAHGLLSGRWERSWALEAAAARVAHVPVAVGDWRAEPQPADPEVYAQAGAVAYWVRTYRRPGADRQRVTVILMCGPAGKMSVHTPDVCYRGAGYRQDGPEATVTLRPAPRPGSPRGAAESGRGDELRVAQFSKPAVALTARLRIYWAWSADGAWKAPERPRWTFAGAPFLYKLYAVQDQRDGEAVGADAVSELLRDLLPQLEHCLFPRAED